MRRLESLSARKTPTLVLLLAIVGALLIVTPRRAGAAPNCKPNRATCTVNSQCCSRVCTTGLCAAAPTTSTSTTTTTTSSTTTTTMGQVGYCGDGVVDAHEQCDHGANNSYTDECLPSCRLNVCGDGFLKTTGSNPEACDDGNQVTETMCPYGTSICSACKADCSAVLNLTGNVCGDGVVDPMYEDCDDGNPCTESQCPYGMAVCEVCNSSCKTVMRTGPICGDGSVDAPYETCDDGNPACGSCSADCQVVQLAQATGLIVPVPLSELVDGDSFTIDDGLGTVAVFEFDSDANVSPGATAIALDTNTTRSHAADKIAEAINGHATLQVDAVADGPVVLLTHQVKTSLGNQAIATSAGVSTDFYVTGMSGGMGGDCATGDKCTSDADCASGLCGSVTPGVCD